jgi:hypothetical protein
MGCRGQWRGWSGTARKVFELLTWPVIPADTISSMVSDFYAPNHQAPQTKPRPGEPLWSVRKDHVTWSAELRFHGEFGVEAQILRDGGLVIGRRFDTRALAIQWAEEERKAIR